MSFLTQLAYTSSYDSTYDSYSSTDSAAAAGLGVGMILFMVVISLLVYLFTAFCLMKLFQKAGRQDAWAAWVPIYNTWVLFEIVGRPGWWALAGLVPVVGGLIALVVWILASLDLAKSFGKETGFAVLLILLPIIGLPMLAFGDAHYRGPAGPEGAKSGAHVQTGMVQPQHTEQHFPSNTPPQA